MHPTNENDAQHVLETERLALRRWRAGDVELLSPIVQDPTVVRYVGSGQPWPDERVRGFVSAGLEHQAPGGRGYCLWPVVHKQDGAVIGYSGIQPLPDSDETEIGWVLAQPYWGQGLATEIAAATARFAFDRVRLARLVAIAYPANTASTRVMRKIGMRFEEHWRWRGIEVVRYALEAGDAGASAPT